MKLDYLQFLELEIFTRFGTKLDKSMKKRIQRGQILREILKQESQSPVTIEFQLAWLIAYNEGLFDTITLEHIKTTLQYLQTQVDNAGLSIDTGREQWKQLINAWLKQYSNEQAT